MFSRSASHLLEDHLLGGLGGDPAEDIGSFRKLDLHVDFGFVAVQLLCLLEGNLCGWIRHVRDDVLDGEEIDLPGFLVEARLQVFIRLVILARGRQNGVFDGRDDHVGLDTLFLGERFDRLHQRVLHCRSHHIRLSRVFIKIPRPGDRA